VTDLGTGAKPTGRFDVVVEIDPGLAYHTVYRPDPIGMINHPIVAWGNGGCSKDSTGFAELRNGAGLRATVCDRQDIRPDRPNGPTRARANQSESI
jgi:hypothetical protein